MNSSQGSDEIQAILLDDCDLYEEEVEWKGEAFEKMINLRQLSIEGLGCYTSPKYLPNSLRVLELEYYPSSTLPDSFDPSNLFILNLPYSSSLQTLGNLSMVSVFPNKILMCLLMIYIYFNFLCCRTFSACVI